MDHIGVPYVVKLGIKMSVNHYFNVTEEGGKGVKVGSNFWMGPCETFLFFWTRFQTQKECGNWDTGARFTKFKSLSFFDCLIKKRLQTVLWAFWKNNCKLYSWNIKSRKNINDLECWLWLTGNLDVIFRVCKPVSGDFARHKIAKKIFLIFYLLPSIKYS